MSIFDFNITVNGNRCKQHTFEGKQFIEAKDGSEYSLEIKNNAFKRILAVCSVDGLNVLSGKSASPEDSGYIINGYSSEKIKGFRISDTEWSLFKFGYKSNGNTYAQSKEDGSEQNCGVIGVKLYYEKEEYNYSPIPLYPHFINCNYDLNDIRKRSPDYTYPSSIENDLYCHPVTYCSNNINVDNITSNIKSNNINSNITYYEGNQDYQEYDNCSISTIEYSNNLRKKNNFDMGTEFGKSEQSKITTINFNRGILACSFNIYYASRKSLISMGIPLSNSLKINSLPQSFPNQYCTPPKNWKG